MHSPAVYVKEKLLSLDSYLCFRLALLNSVFYFFFLYRSTSLSLCTVFDSISSNIDEVFSINPSTNVFVFGDFNVHHKDWLTYSGEIDRLGELCYNIISNDLTLMVNFLMWIPDYDSQSPALLDLILSSDASIYFTMAFPPLGNSDHVVSVPIDFPVNLKQDAPFHHIVYNYSPADWDGLCDHSRDVPQEDIYNSVLLQLLVNFVSGFRLELRYISLILSIRRNLTHLHGLQLMLLPLFIEIAFFVCTKRINFLNLE